MPTDENLSQVVFTDKARCRDCYRCLRACPVKAIEMHAGQARVVAERCIACGTCIRSCPQQAKAYRNDVEQAVRLLKSGHPVAASIAPSFASVYGDWQRHRLPSALRRLGFSYVGETAIGAFEVASATAEHVKTHPNQVHVATACPVVVNYVEQYKPDLVGTLTPIVSPMLAHAHGIRAKLGPDVKVIFIGPCVAKKAEAERHEHAGLVDCVLTFGEMQQWLDSAGIDLAQCEESAFDETPAGDARFFPVSGGMARTAGLSTDLLASDVHCTSGFEELDAMLDRVKGMRGGALVECLFCPQGCVHGPGISQTDNIYQQRDALIAFAAANAGQPPMAIPPSDQLPEHLRTSFQARLLAESEAITEEAIQATLAQTGKAALADQLNCGACGYGTCRDKAIAILRGMAEAEMCMPHMRRLAERRTDRIIETSPNGIVILDKDLKILSMNPSFRKMFTSSEAVLGKPISYLIDPEPFEKLAAGEADLIQEVRRYPNYQVMCHQITYALRDEGQYIGILVDTSASTRNAEELKHLRAQTQAQARELLEHQILMGQQIAKLLGESTARGETLVRTLLEMAGENDGDTLDRWRDIYTSK